MLTDGKKIIDFVEGILHDDTQVHEKCIDLTVDKVMKVKDKGSLDFGGSEFQPSDTEEITPKKRMRMTITAGGI